MKVTSLPKYLDKIKKKQIFIPILVMTFGNMFLNKQNKICRGMLEYYYV